MKKFLLALSLAFSLFVSCTNYEEMRIDLSTGWEYSIDGASYKAIPDQQLSKLEDLVPHKIGFIWLRHSFTVPPQLNSEDLGVYLGRITMADETRVNGLFIGTTGKFRPAEFSAWNIPRYYAISKKLINPENNFITIKIWCDGEASLVSNPFIGLPEDARLTYARESFWNSKIYLIFAFFSFVIGFYHLVIFLRRRVEKENLTFSIINIVNALYLSVMYIFEIPNFPPDNLSFLWFQKIFSCTLPFVIVFFTTTFVFNFLKETEKFQFMLARLIFSLIPVSLIFMSVDYPTLHQMVQYTTFFLIPLIIYPLVVFIKNFKKHPSHSVALLIGFVPTVILAISDIVIHYGLKLNDMTYFAQFGWMLTIIVLLYLMAGRFANARNQAEYLNKNLEKEVSNRTDRLSESMKMLEDERNKSLEDLRLAEHVQQTFYQKEPQALSNWDTALYFKPVSGISRDLYDFFINNNNLYGAGLFEISGNGIASGLVSMLAKTIIDQKFKEGFGEKLSSVMSSINSTIAQTKGNIPNYLTGSLLRIKGDIIEYINGGSSKLYMRRESTGKVASIQAPANVSDGSSIQLGIPGQYPEFKTLKFSMQKDDCLILYTSSFAEAENSYGVPFGSEKIIRALASSGKGNAQDKLKTIMDIFNLYTAGTNIKDDITVIILQKK
ncbi:SpoIIE family protein phosphatase [Treponema sp.]|uniref:SpoIIE family protein phosphatase n=1 Tax=Treponema sp. TaxID=166 RepID=UPI0025CD4B74|nr:SpoIIE family protein phosphatase [Treponema sp.]MCR5218725.1 SpoIIE family protein phosphatase [Treponema sp.]